MTEYLRKVFEHRNVLLLHIISPAWCHCLATSLFRMYFIKPAHIREPLIMSGERKYCREYYSLKTLRVSDVQLIITFSKKICPKTIVGFCPSFHPKSLHVPLLHFVFPLCMKEDLAKISSNIGLSHHSVLQSYDGRQRGLALFIKF